MKLYAVVDQTNSAIAIFSTKPKARGFLRRKRSKVHGQCSIRTYTLDAAPIQLADFGKAFTSYLKGVEKTLNMPLKARTLLAAKPPHAGN